MKNDIRIHVVPTFHHDIAYLMPEEDYHARASEILTKAIDLMSQFPEYTFTVEQAYFFERFWNENPEQQEKLKQFAKNGQLHFAPGFWTVPDMCMPSGESLYMQATMGKRAISKLLGEVELETAFIADCWGHHAQLPQIMTQCGYNYYTFSRCMVPELDVENFVWKGLDGSQIQGHWMSSSYYGIMFPEDTELFHAEEQHWDEASREGVLKVFESNKAHCGDEIQVMPAGGDMMMPASCSVPTISALQKDPSFPRIAFSSLTDAFNNIDYIGKPVFNKEFISSLKGTFATNIGIKQYNNQMENTLYALEVLSVMKNKKMDYSEQWKLALKNQFHDILCGTICDGALVQVMSEYEQSIARLDGKREALSVEGMPVYFNALPFPVRAKTEDNRHFIYADALSYGVVRPVEKSPAELPYTYENDYYIAQINARGFIESLTERGTGEQLVGHSNIPFGCLQLQYDNGDNWVDFEFPNEDEPRQYVTNVPDPFDRSKLERHSQVELLHDCVDSATVSMLGQGAMQISQEGRFRYYAIDIPFTTTITLYKDSPRIDYHTEFDCNHRRLRIRVAFPANVPQGKVFHQIPYGIVERGEGVQPANMFMDYRNTEAGLGLINKGFPSNNTEDGIMMLTLFRSVAMEYKCQSELSYNIGNHISCDYAIIPHGTNADRTLWEEALSFNCRPVLTTREPLLDLSVEGAFISAMRYDGDDVFLRIYNGCSKETCAVITVPEEFSAYTMADGCMNPVGKTMDISSKIVLPLDAFKVEGLRLIRKK